MKNTICAALGTIGGFIASLFGGWSASLTTLLIFMLIDYATGLVVAGVFHKSPKTANGGIESNVGRKGLVRKFSVFLLILVGHRLDLTVGTAYIRDGACIAFIVNELISIVENVGLMGLPIPAAIKNAIEVLTHKNDTQK